MLLSWSHRRSEKGSEVLLVNMGILTHVIPSNREREAERILLYNGRIKLKLSYCVYVSTKDLILAHVYIYVYVVSLNYYIIL